MEWKCVKIMIDVNRIQLFGGSTVLIAENDNDLEKLVNELNIVCSRRKTEDECEQK